MTNIAKRWKQAMQEMQLVVSRTSKTLMDWYMRESPSVSASSDGGHTEMNEKQAQPSQQNLEVESVERDQDEDMSKWDVPNKAKPTTSPSGMCRAKPSKQHVEVECSERNQTGNISKWEMSNKDELTGVNRMPSNNIEDNNNKQTKNGENPQPLTRRASNSCEVDTDGGKGAEASTARDHQDSMGRCANVARSGGKRKGSQTNRKEKSVSETCDNGMPHVQWSDQHGGEVCDRHTSLRNQYPSKGEGMKRRGRSRMRTNKAKNKKTWLNGEVAMEHARRRAMKRVARRERNAMTWTTNR
jgi:hypothetical protein